MRLFQRRKARDTESRERIEKIRGEIIARSDDVKRNSKSAGLRDLFSALAEEDFAVKVSGSAPQRPPPPPRDVQAA